MTGTWIIARLTLLRLWRGRTIWLSALLMALPVAFAALIMAAGRDNNAWRASVRFIIELPVLLAVAVHLAPAIGEELENRTHTYLFSRPIDRSSVLWGKLLAVLPIVVGGFVLSTTLTWAITGASGDLPAAISAVAVVAVVGAALSVGAGTLFPRRPLGFVLAYVLLGERLLKFIPGLKYLSATFYGHSMMGQRMGPSEPLSTNGALIGAAALSVAWLVVAMWRVEMAEYSADKE